jgi:glycosyltransferase involved in cell wall biosynthesis
MNISVLVSVKNGARFLAGALHSIFTQTVMPNEVLLVDGHSSDRTAEVAQRFPVVLIQQSKVGIANAYNIGIRVARGDFIAFLSHDDLWVPTKLERQLEALIRHPGASYCVGQVEFFLEQNTVPPSGMRTSWLERPHMAYIMETLFARREVFDRVGGFDESLSTAEDVDWFARARDQHIEAVALDEVLVKKRIHRDNTSLVTAENSHNVLRALHSSVLRKRGSG